MAVKATRQSFGEAIAKIAAKNPQVIVMDADLGKSTMTGEFAKKFPERYFQFGIAEQNLIGTAAGLSLGGKIPFATSFACFLAGRYETIRMSVSYSHSNVKLVGTHAGIAIGEDGYSQMGLEDIALLRPLPNLAIVQPADDLETQQAVAWASEHAGPVYLRLTRQKVQDVHQDDYKFQFGKGDILKQSAVNDQRSAIAIFATGGVVYNALQAAEALEKEGISAAVINMHTIKPMDESLVLRFAKEYPKMIAIEDHNVIGGLGSAISEIVTNAGLQVRILRLGIHGFGESGSPEALYEKFGFSSEKIREAAQKFLHEQV